MKTIPCRTAFDAEARQHLKPIRPFIWAFWMLLVLLGRGESLAVAAAQPQPEPPYRLDWFSLDAGGAQSTGGDFTLSGTLGQSDAGAQSGGDYQMIGGFWAVTLSPHEPHPE